MVGDSKHQDKVKHKNYPRAVQCEPSGEFSLFRFSLPISPRVRLCRLGSSSDAAVVILCTRGCREQNNKLIFRTVLPPRLSFGKHSADPYTKENSDGKTAAVSFKLRRAEPYTVFKAYFRRYCVKKPRKASALRGFLPCLDKNLLLKTAKHLKDISFCAVGRFLR